MFSIKVNVTHYLLTPTGYAMFQLPWLRRQEEGSSSLRCQSIIMSTIVQVTCLSFAQQQMSLQVISAAARLPVCASNTFINRSLMRLIRKRDVFIHHTGLDSLDLVSGHDVGVYESRTDGPFVSPLPCD